MYSKKDVITEITSVLLVLFLFTTACSQHTQISFELDGELRTGIPAAENPLIHVQNRRIVTPDGRFFHIKGIAFGNEVWSNPTHPPAYHHGKEDYARIKSMGFNAVRFYLNYRIFESDLSPFTYKESGFTWLDKNIAWAKEQGIHLVLNMHVPQGGFQSLGKGLALWDVEQNQKRLTALWQEIARRYKDEPTILGYDLVNEPVVSRDISQWEILAKTIVQAIRQVDPYHIIFVERLNAVKNNWNENLNGSMNFILINDTNIVYEFHFYKPFNFTHQGAPWVPSLKGTKSSYPDPEFIEVTGSIKWAGAIMNNPQLPPGDSEWMYLEGTPYVHRDSRYKYAMPVFQARSIGSHATAWFDDIVITEQTANGSTVQTWSLDAESIKGWSYWSQNQTGNVDLAAKKGRNKSNALRISGATADCNAGKSALKILLKKGHIYTISGWARGKNISPKALARLRLDFYTTDGYALPRDKSYLAAEIEHFLEFGRKHNVPLYLGEFGCINVCFKEKRGGIEWVGDVIDICLKNNIHLNYHTYHEIYFGLYLNPPFQPVNTHVLNKELAALFTKKFGH